MSRLGLKVSLVEVFPSWSPNSTYLYFWYLCQHTNTKDIAGQSARSILAHHHNKRVRAIIRAHSMVPPATWFTSTYFARVCPTLICPLAPPSPLAAAPLVLAGGHHWTEARGVSPLQGYNRIANQKLDPRRPAGFLCLYICWYLCPFSTLAPEASN